MEALANKVALSSAVASLASAGASASRSVSLKKACSLRTTEFACNALTSRMPVSRGSRVVCMAKEGAGSGYAAALIELAKSTSSVEAVHNDIEALSKLLANKEFAAFVASPVIGDDKKKGVLKSIALDSGFTANTLSFLNLLVDKKRITLLEEIILAFEDMYCEVSNTQVAVVTSAVKLENSQQALIAKKLQSMTGAKNIKLKNVVDPSLIAGFIVKYGRDGSCQIDMSVKGQLDRLAAQFEFTDNALPSAS